MMNVEQCKIKYIFGQYEAIYKVLFERVFLCNVYVIMHVMFESCNSSHKNVFNCTDCKAGVTLKTTDS